MGPIALGILQGGLSIAGGMARNAAIEDAASKQYESNKLFIERDYSVNQTQLQDAAYQVNEELGMALSNLVVQARSAAATEAAATAETNVYGNLAYRKQAMVSMKEALSADSLAQAAESKIVDVQTQMKQVKYDTESRFAQNTQNYNNMLSQRQSGFEIMANGMSAALSGYNTGQNLVSAQNSLAMQNAQLAMTLSP